MRVSWGIRYGINLNMRKRRIEWNLTVAIGIIGYALALAGFLSHNWHRPKIESVESSPLSIEQTALPDLLIEEPIDVDDLLNQESF